MLWCPYCIFTNFILLTHERHPIGGVSASPFHPGAKPEGRTESAAAMSAAAKEDVSEMIAKTGNKNMSVGGGWETRKGKPDCQGFTCVRSRVLRLVKCSSPNSPTRK